MKRNGVKKTEKLMAMLALAFALILGGVLLPETVVKADENVTLSEDSVTNEGTAGHYYVNMPVTGKNTLTISDQDIAAGKNIFMVYDDGGINGEYSANCNGVLTICVPENYCLRVSGSRWIENYAAQEYLKFFDGNDTEGEPICTVAGSGYDVPPCSTTGRYMSILFVSNGQSQYDGFDLTVEAVENKDYNISFGESSGGTMTVSPASAKMGTEVTLTAKPEEWYLLSDLSIAAGNGENIAYTRGWLADNTAKFTMPGNDITVTPTFTDTWTAGGGLFINMPKTGTENITVPAGVSSFKVYDDGGKNGLHGNNCDGKIVLTAPEGATFSVTGTVKIKNGVTLGDHLRIYDGMTGDNENILLDISNSADTVEHSLPGNPDDKNYVITKGNILTIYFVTNHFGTSLDGLDLTVTVHDPNVAYPVIIKGAAGGLVESNKTKAKSGEEVKLTVKPDDGYQLYEFTLTYEGGPVEINGFSGDNRYSWYSGSNEVKFYMPDGPVKVEAKFTTYPYVRIPAQNSADNPLEAVIPGNVKSFRVCGDQDVYSNYSNNDYGYLLLTAPEGCRLQLTGTVKTNDTNDYMSVYDGMSVATGLGKDKYGNTVGEDIGVLTSSGRSVLLHFVSDNIGNYAPGPQITVRVFRGYSLKVDDQITGGTVSVSDNVAAENEKVTLTINPEAGNSVQSVSCNYGTYSREILPDEEGKYGFIMPSADVTVTAVFGRTLPATLTIDSVSYNGLEQTNIMVRDGDQVLKENDDYSIISFFDEDGKNPMIPQKAGIYSALLKGRGQYGGTRLVTYQIEPRPVTLSVSVRDKIYDESDYLKPSFIDCKVNGILGEDEVVPDLSRVTIRSNSIDVGESIPVILDGAVALTGRDAKNYTVKEQPTGLTVNIVKADWVILKNLYYGHPGKSAAGMIGFPEGAGLGQYTVVSGADILEKEPEYYDKGLLVKFRQTAMDGSRAVITVPVTGSKNYNDYTFTLTFEIDDICTIFFEANGENVTGEMSYQEFHNGTDVTIYPNGFSYEGYIFTGWNTVSSPNAENPGVFYPDKAVIKNFIPDISDEGVVRLYALWKKPIAAEAVLTGWTYGDTPNTPRIKVGTNPGNGLVTWMYKVREADDSMYSEAVPTDAGDYTVRGTIAETPQYIGGTAEADFVITPRPLTITAQDKAFAYNGTAQSWPKYAVDGLAGDDEIEAIVTGSITCPEESPVVNKLESFRFTAGKADNYTITTANGTLTMTNASVAITITAASQEWVYDGDAHSNSMVTVTDGTLLSGDTLTATANGSVTNVSETKKGNNPIGAGYKVLHGETDVTANYAITPVAGTLTITKANSVIDTLPTAKQLKYTGLEQELLTEGISAGGTLMYSNGSKTEATEEYTASVPKKTDAGSYFVWYKVVGDENHNDCDGGRLEVGIAKAADKVLDDLSSDVSNSETGFSIALADVMPSDAGMISAFTPEEAETISGHTVVSDVRVSDEGTLSGTISNANTGDTVKIPVKVTALNYDCRFNVIITVTGKAAVNSVTTEIKEGQEVRSTTLNKEVAVKQKIDASSLMKGGHGKYVVEPKGAAKVDKKKLLITVKKPGNITITAYDKVDKKWVAQEVIHLTADKPVVKQKTIKAAPQGPVIDGSSNIDDGTLTPDKWESSKSSVASVDAKTGMITPLSNGNATITAYYGEGKNTVKVKFRIKVQ